MERVNEILEQKGWNSTFGHSFRTGRASYCLAKGVNPDILRVAERWKSNAFEVYLRSFEHTVTTHTEPVAEGWANGEESYEGVSWTKLLALLFFTSYHA